MIRRDQWALFSRLRNTQTPANSIGLCDFNSVILPDIQRGGGSHSAGTAPIITVFIPGTPLQTTPLQKDA